jgi:archaellum component FlaC
MTFFRKYFRKPTTESEVTKETPVDRFNVEIIEEITIDDFNERTKTVNLDLYKRDDKIANINSFYTMMRNTCNKISENYKPVYFKFQCDGKNVGGYAIWIMEFDEMRNTCNKISENYKPVYFNFQCDGENVGGCAIWIMDLDETRKFAYFYGLHKFPQYFDEPDKFSSIRLLSSVISYCDTNKIDFICLPRPCIIPTTKLWYSIGMTFDIKNDGSNYLSYLKREPKQDSNLKKHSSTITNDLSKVSEKVKAINRLEKEITNSEFGPFHATDIGRGGLLYKDNYKKAIIICDKKTKDKEDDNISIVKWN